MSASVEWMIINAGIVALFSVKPAHEVGPDLAVTRAISPHMLKVPNTSWFAGNGGMRTDQTAGISFCPACRTMRVRQDAKPPRSKNW